MAVWNVLEAIQKPDLVIPTHVLSNVYTVIGATSVIALLLVVEEFKLELDPFSILQILLITVQHNKQKPNLVIPTHVLSNVYTVIGAISVIALSLVVVDFKLELDPFSILQILLITVQHNKQKPDLVIPIHVIHQFLCQYLFNVYTVIGQNSVLVLSVVVEEFKLELETFSILQILLRTVQHNKQKPDLVTSIHVLDVYTVIGQIGVIALSIVVEECKLELETFSIQIVL